MGATPGMGGTRLAQSAWLPVLRTLGTRPWCGKQLYVAGAGQVFDAAGQLIDPKVEKLLSEFMAGLRHLPRAREKLIGRCVRRLLAERLAAGDRQVFGPGEPSCLRIPS